MNNYSIQNFSFGDGASLYQNLVPHQDLANKEMRDGVEKPVFNVEQRSKSYAELKHRRDDWIQKELKQKFDKEMEECTFRPSVKWYEARTRNGHSADGQRGTPFKSRSSGRNFDDFINDQERFLKKKLDKEKEQRDNMNSLEIKYLNSSKINNKSIQIL